MQDLSSAQQWLISEPAPWQIQSGDNDLTSKLDLNPDVSISFRRCLATDTGNYPRDALSPVGSDIVSLKTFHGFKLSSCPQILNSLYVNTGWSSPPSKATGGEEHEDERLNNFGKLFPPWKLDRGKKKKKKKKIRFADPGINWLRFVPSFPTIFVLDYNSIKRFNERFHPAFLDGFDLFDRIGEEWNCDASCSRIIRAVMFRKRGNEILFAAERGSHC